MARASKKYMCTECGTHYPKAIGKCTNCGLFETIVEVEDNDTDNKINHHKGYSGVGSSGIIKMSDIQSTEYSRLSTGFSELDRVLGGGLVEGSVNLIGGDPGIGKSTILLQVVYSLAEKGCKILYVTGEESPSQVKIRGHRLGMNLEKMHILASANVEEILTECKNFKPQILIIDSIQTMYLPDIKSSPGSVSQVKDSTQEITRYCKGNDVSCFIIGHITKDGAIAGPKALEHIVDAVFYFEGEQGSKYRMLRSNKNRFGEVNELGVFAMTEDGLKEVKNPSAIFLSKYEKDVAGSALMVNKEGSRPLLIEIQTLVSESNAEMVRRICLGLDKDRLILLMAILQKAARSKFYKYDVYVSVVGGLKVNETASDLALAVALLSSLEEKTIPRDYAFFGEIGLTGEIRPVPNGEERIKEAIKHGMKKIVLPKANAPKKADYWYGKAEIIQLSDVTELIEFFYNKLK